jgi:hypothetical protein
MQRILVRTLRIDNKGLEGLVVEWKDGTLVVYACLELGGKRESEMRQRERDRNETERETEMRQK